MTSYGVTHLWADAWDAAGFAGVRYLSRFDTGASGSCLGLFENDGEATFPADPTPTPADEIALEAGFRIVDAPSRNSLTIVDPPS